MPDARGYDVIVIGGGLGGYPAAIRLSRKGYRVALIEEHLIGGECTNYGCVPTKALYRLAEALETIKRIYGEVPKLPYRPVFEWVGKIVKESREGIEYLLEKNGVEVYKAKGVLASPECVVKLSTGEELRAKNIILAVGTDPRPLPNIGFDGKHVISNRELFSMEEPPSRILIVGAGAIGCEIAHILALMGTEVHVVEILPRIAPGVDIDLARILEKYLTELGVKFYKKRSLEAVEKKGDGVEAKLSDGTRLNVDVVLVSIGRVPKAREAGAENAGVELDRKGFVVLKEGYRTSNPRIYAAGDVVGGPLLAHKALVESIVAAESVYKGEVLPRLDYHTVPIAIFTGLEIGAVGYTEEELKSAGIEYTKIKIPMAFLSAIKIREGRYSFIKILASKDYSRIYGVHIIAPNATEVVSAFIPIYLGRMMFGEIAKIPYPHLTVSEIVREFAEYILGEPVHIFVKR